MAESCKPTGAAVVAAPILKLWPANSIAGRLAAVNSFLIASTNLCLDKGICPATEKELLEGSLI